MLLNSHIALHTRYRVPENEQLWLKREERPVTVPLQPHDLTLILSGLLLW